MPNVVVIVDIVRLSIFSTKDHTGSTKVKLLYFDRAFVVAVSFLDCDIILGLYEVVSQVSKMLQSKIST
jgi:hypothetical protein